MEIIEKIKMIPAKAAMPKSNLQSSKKISVIQSMQDRKSVSLFNVQMKQRAISIQIA